MLTYLEKPPKICERNSVTAVLIKYDREKRKLVPLKPLFSWFVERRSFERLLRDIMFHYALVENIERYVEEDDVQLNKPDSLDIGVFYKRADGKAWGMRFPVSVPYEVSHETPSFPINRRH